MFLTLSYTISPKTLPSSRRHILITTALLLLLAASCLAQSSPTPIRAAVFEDSPPLSFRDSQGHPAGFAVSLLKALEVRIGRPITIHLVSVESARHLLASREIDLVAGVNRPLNPTADRLYSVPAYQSELRIFVPRDDFHTLSIRDLAGRHVAVQDADLGEEQLTRSGIPILLSRFRSQPEAILAFCRGKVDAFVGDYFQGQYFIQKHNLRSQVKALGTPVLTADWCLMLRQDSGPLLPTLNTALESLEREGTLRLLRDRSFGQDYFGADGSSQRFLHLLFSIGSIGLAVLLLSLGTIYVLRRKVRRAHTQLQDISDRYQALIDNASDLIMVLEPSGIIRYVSPLSEKLLGHTSGEVTGKKIFEFIHPEDVLGAISFVRLLDHQEDATIECRFVSKDGSFRHIEGLGKNLVEAPAVQGILLSARDVSSRKKASRLQSAVHRISEAANSCPDLAAFFAEVHTALGEFMPVQNFYVALHDVESGTLEFPYFVDEVDVNPGQAPLGQGLTSLVLRTGQPLLVDGKRLEELRASGEVVPAGTPCECWLGVPLRADGVTIGVLTVQSYRRGETYGKDEQDLLLFVSDQLALIIQRIRSADALRESEEKYRILVEGFPLALAILHGTTIAYCNPACARMLGVEGPDALSGRNILDFLPETPPHSLNPDELTTRLGRGATHTLRREGGDTFPAEIRSQVIQFRGRSSLQLIASDITERIRMEEELLRGRKLESLGVLAGGIAHDFNNILSAVLGNISLAKRPSPGQRDILPLLEEAEKATLRARDLTAQLLTFSRGGAPVRKLASIAEMIRESATFALRGSGSGCHLQIAPDLWPLEADESQLAQVVNNLVINASQAMGGKGTVVIQAENLLAVELPRTSFRRGPAVHLSVSDKGVGIPPENFQRIFDPYFTTKADGTGLGLATCYSIVTKHEGTIEPESEPGLGTTFHVYLPASPRELVPEPEPQEIPSEGSGRVLVMDDEAMVRRVAGRMLETLGYEPDFAENGEEALFRYQTAHEEGRPFDVVLMDLTIPGGMGGQETIIHLLELDPEARAIVSSGYSSDPVMSDYARYGFCGVMSKPYRLEELAAALHRVKTGVPVG